MRCQNRMAKPKSNIITTPSRTGNTRDGVVPLMGRLGDALGGFSDVSGFFGDVSGFFGDVSGCFGEAVFMILYTVG